MWVEVDDIKGRWVRDEPIVVSDEVIETLIDDAEVFIRLNVPNIEARATANEDIKKQIIIIVSNMIIQYLSTDGPYLQQSQAVGPYSRFVSYKASARFVATLDLNDVSALQERRGMFTIETAPNMTSHGQSDLWRTISVTGL